MKAQAGISLSDTSKDAQYLSLINGITDLVKQTIHRDIESKQYVDYLSGDNSTILMLPNYPVQSIISVVINDDGWFGQGPTANAQTLVQGTDYALMSGVKGVGSNGAIRRIGAVWRRRPSWAPGKVAMQPSAPNGNICVTYMAGFSPVPAGIQYAVNAAVIRAALMSPVGGAAQSMGYEDASVSMLSPKDLAGMFGSIEKSLGAYKSIVC